MARYSCSNLRNLRSVYIVRLPNFMDRGNRYLKLMAFLFKGAFGSRFALSETLNRATPLIFTGLAAAVAFRAKFWNIGAEGQLYFGALAATILGTGAINLPPLLMVPFLFIVRCVGWWIGFTWTGVLENYTKSRRSGDYIIVEFRYLAVGKLSARRSPT